MNISVWVLLLLNISNTVNASNGECYWERSNLNSMGLVKTLTCSNVTMEALHAFTKNLDVLININIFNSDITTVDNETFTIGNYSKVIKLNLQNDKIRAIESNALDAFSGLKILTVSKNRITTADFIANHGQLLELILSNNSISELEGYFFKNLSSLYLLDLSYNNLQALANSTFSLLGLKRLYLNKNNISALEPTTFEHNKLLVILNLEYNRLQVIDAKVFGKLENLQELYLNDNLLSKVEVGAFQSLKNLWYLKLSHNKLEALVGNTFSGLISMEHLHLEGNRIQRIEPQSFLHLIKLSFVDLRGNNISALENGTFTGLQRLPLLNLTNLNIGRVNSGAFAGLDALQTLDLGSNKIEVLETHAFSGLSSLENLLLANNAIRQIQPHAFSGLNRLIMLNIRDTNISVLASDTFAEMPALTTLEVMASNIIQLQPGAFNGLKNLITLVLGNHYVGRDFKSELELKNGTFWGLSKLKALYFKNLRVGTVRAEAFNGLAELRHLNLQNCTIANLSAGAFYGLRKLSSIRASCGNDKLAQHPTGRSYQLCNLSMESLEGGALEDLYADSSDAYVYNNIYLTDNRLSVLAANTFSRVSNIVELGLDNNNLREIKVGAFNGLSFHMQPCSYAVNYENYREVRTLMCNTLFLNNNTLKVLGNNTFYNLRRVVYLRLDHSAIEEIEPGAFDYLFFNDANNSANVLNTLFLSNNKLKLLRANSFRTIQHLAILKLDDNFIKMIEPGTFEGLTFQLPSDVEAAKSAIYLNNNKLTILLNGTFEGIKNIAKLRLDNNDIKEIESGAFKGLYFPDISPNYKTYKSDTVRVNILNLSYNKLTGLARNAFSGTQNLAELNLEHNNIQNVAQEAFSALNQLIILSLSHNKIDGLTSGLFRSLQNLRILDLSNNRMSSVNEQSFLGLTNIQQLLIHSNRIVDVPLGTFNNLISLENLQLGGNSLSKFRTGSFSKLERLKYLNVSNNNFSTLNENVLYPLRNLELLDLDNNELTYINHSSLLMHLPSLRFISINNNNWPCHALIHMIKSFRRERIYYLFNTTAQYSKENVDGVLCVEGSTEDLNVNTSMEHRSDRTLMRQLINQTLDEWGRWQNNSTLTNLSDIVNVLDNINEKFDNLLSLQRPVEKFDWAGNLSKALADFANFTIRKDVQTSSNSNEVVRLRSDPTGVTLSLNPLMTMLVLLMSISSVTICLVLIMTMCNVQTKLKQVFKLRKTRSEMELLDTSA